MRISGSRVLLLSALQVCAAAMACADTIVLTQDTAYTLPTNKSQWHNGDYTFESENANNLTVKGSSGSGKFINNGKAEFSNLGILYIYDSVNTWSDIGGGDKDISGYGYGGVLAAKAEGGEDGVYFIENASVYIKNVVYDASDWGQNSSHSTIYGGAIYAKTGDDVLFSGNGYVSLENIGSLSSHDTNYSYKDFYGYGGAVHAEDLFIKGTIKDVDIFNCYILQGVCTDAEGEGKGGAVYAHRLQINDNGGNVNLTGNYIHTANNSQGGALYITQSGEINNNGLHVQISGNYVESAPDKKYGRLEDSADADCYAYGGAIFVTDNAEFCIENNVGNIRLNGNKAVADYSAVTSQGEGEEHMDDGAVAFGGAVYLKQSATMSISHNGKGDPYSVVEFSGNSVSAKGTNAGKAYGGVVYMESGSTFTVQGNGGNVSFSGNTANRGGAVYIEDNASLAISDNAGGVLFSQNQAAANGGALYAAGTVELCRNGDVVFTDNIAKSGSAIYAADGAHVSILNNSSVSFVDSDLADGNVVYLNSNAIFDLNNNGEVVFSIDMNTHNPIVYAAESTQLNMCGNEQVMINECAVVSNALIHSQGVININNNKAGVLITGNNALLSSKGIIYSDGAGAVFSLVYTSFCKI